MKACHKVEQNKVSRLLVLTAVLALTSLSISPAIASSKSIPKIGSSCAKEKSQQRINSVTLVCTKLDSKLTWQPSILQIQLNIWRDLRAQEAASTEASPALNVYMSPTVNIDSANQILRSLNQAAKLWQAQYLPQQPLPTFFFTEKDRNWAIEKFKDLDLKSDGFLTGFDDEVNRNGSRGNWAGITGENGKLWMSYMIGSEKLPDSNDLQVAAHEYTHLAQFSIASSGASELSCWQVEGGAYFYGIYLGATSESQLRSFIKERNTQKYFLGFSGLSRQSPKNWAKLIDQFGTGYDSRKCGPDGAYPVGSAMHEYLYSLKGHAGIIKMIESVSTQKDFYKGVEQVYGKDWSTLKGELVKYLKISVAQLG